MVSKRNQRLLLEKCSDNREFHYGLRKLTVGVASVLLGTTVFLGGQVVHADTVNSGEASIQVKQPVASVTGSSVAVSQVAVNENQSSAASSVVVSSAQNASQSVSRVASSVNQGSAQASSQVDSGTDNKVLQSSNDFSSAIEMSLANSSVDFGSSASAAQKFQVSASDTTKPMIPQMMVMAVNDSHYQMNKVVSTGRDLWMAFDVPFVWYQPSQLGNGVLALGDGHHNGDLSPWKFQVYTQWHRDSDNGQWQFVSGYTSDPAHYALETSGVRILGSQSQNGHTFTMAALPIAVNAYTLKDQLQSGGYYIMVPGLNAQAGLDQLSGSWTASIPVGANGQIPLVRLGVTVSKIQYVTGTNHDQVISSVNVHQDIIRNGTAQAVNLSGIPSGYRLEYEQPSLTPVYSGYIPNDTAVNHSNCYISINSDGTLTVSVPVTNSNIPADNNIKVNTAIDVVTDANYTPAVPYLPSGVTLGNPSDSTSDNSWLDSFSYDTATQTIHTSGWHASNKAKGAKYHYIVLWDDTDKVVLAKKAVQANMRPDVQKVYPNEFNALYSGWDTSFAITSPYMQTHTLKVISEYTTDPEGNNVVASNIFDRTNIDNITKLDINKVNYAANQQVHHLVYLTDQTKQYTTSNTMQKSDFVHSDSGLTQLDKDVLGQPMVIDWDHPTIQNSSTVYSDGRANKTAAFGQKVDVTFDGDTVVYTAHLGESRRYRVIEDLPNGTQKVVYEIDAIVLKHSDGKYYADPLPTSGTYNSSHYSATINPSSSTGQVYFESTDPGYAAMAIDDLPGYTWSVVPNASLGSNYSQGISFTKAYTGTKIGNYTCNGNELIFDLLFGMNKYNSIAPSGDIHIHYTGHSQTATINYIDTATNKILHTDMITGLSDLNSGYTTAKEIGILVGQGYQVVSDSTNGSAVVYDHADNVNQTFIVRLSHKYVPVEPGQPILPGQKTSGGETIDGGHQSDLYKTVTRTIVLKTPGQADQTIIQTVKLTRSASVDEVTGHVTYGTWSTGSWPDYHVPAKVHYTADKTMISSQMVDDTTVDQTVTVSYSLNHETATLTFIDDDTREVLVTDTANGLYDSDIFWDKNEADQISQFEKQGYVLVSNDFKSNPRSKFTDGLNAYTIHFTHGHQDVSHDYIVTRTINYVDTNGTHLKPSTVQSLTFTRTGVQDLVTKDISWNITPAQSFAAVNDLYILGYKTDMISVPAAEANWNDRDSTVDVHYQVADSTVTVNFVDVTGHVVVTTPVTSQVGSTVDLAAQIPDGWVAYNTNIPTRVVIGVNSTYINYLIVHRLAFVKFTDGVKAGAIIPGTKSKTFNEKTNADNLVTHASYTVNIWADEAHTHKLSTKTYHTDFIRNAAVDAITGDVYYYNWSEGGKHVFAGFTRQASDGYQAVVVPSWTATQANPVKTIDLVAQPQQLSGTIQYQTVDGKVVSTQAFMGNSSVALSAPTGYTLMADDVTIMPVPGRNQTYTVYVRPTQTLYTVADKLPAGMESLSKTITRIVHITEANGHVCTIKQAVHFTRTATVKADGSIEYSNWQATGRTVMNKVFLPKRHGYHIVVDGDLAKVNVTADMSDSVVNVKYVKD